MAFKSENTPVLIETVQSWSKVIKEVLSKLATTNPDESCLGEIYYWRDISRLLSALEIETKNDFVEITI
jgi:hypothetical protein